MPNNNGKLGVEQVLFYARNHKAGQIDTATRAALVAIHNAITRAAPPSPARARRWQRRAPGGSQRAANGFPGGS
jgi:hypothetical protein